MSLLLLFKSPAPVSLSVASSAETASAETVAERLSVTIASVTEDSSASADTERVSIAVTMSSEAASASTLTERVSIAAATAAEDSTALTVAERVGASVTTASETASAETLTERLSLATSSATEDASAASATERLTIVTASATETGSASTDGERLVFAASTASESSASASIAERLTVASATASETTDAASLTERLSIVVASASEDSSTATDAERIAFAVTASSETTSTEALTVVPPAVSLAIASATETESAASLALPVALPAIAALAPGQPGAWFDSTDGLSGSAWTDRLGSMVATAVGTPVIDDTAINGRAAAQLDAVSWFTTSPSPVGAATDAVTLVVLARNNSPATDNPTNLLVDLSTISPAPTFSAAQIYASTDQVLGSVYADNGGSEFWEVDRPGAVPNGTWALLELIATPNEPDTQYVVNGVTVEDISFQNLPWRAFADLSALGIGGPSSPTFGKSPFPSEMEIAVVAALPVALSVEDRQIVYNWITDTYGVELPTIYDLPVSLSVASSTETLSDESVSHNSAPVSSGGGGIVVPRPKTHPGVAITVTPPPAVSAWVVPPVRVSLGTTTTTPEPARSAWVVPDPTVSLGEMQTVVSPAVSRWVALTPDVLTAPDPDEELLILALADGML